MSRYRLLILQLVIALAAALLLGAGTFLAVQSFSSSLVVFIGALLLAGGAAIVNFPRRMRAAKDSKERREFQRISAKKLNRLQLHVDATEEATTAMAPAVQAISKQLTSTDSALAGLSEQSRDLRSAVARLNASLEQHAAQHAAGNLADVKPVVTRPAGGSSTTTGQSSAPSKPAALPPVTSLERRSREMSPIGKDEKNDWIASRQTDAIFAPRSSTSAYRTSRLPYTHEVPVAIIADDFTFESFRPEFNAHRLTPSNWRKVMDKENPRVFFCESAWQGGPPSEHPWQGKIYASVRFQNENRSVLLEILEYCKDRCIPTVFWNKEDPIHFSDRINDFIRTAALFDYVFTTAEECVPLYIRDVGVKWAGVLPFAVQPKIFNPIGAYAQDESVNFAGTWYHRYPHRTKAASQILDRVLESGRELVIYDRMHSSPSPAYAYPEKYRPYTRPAIPYLETADAYKKSRFGITLNTITDSRTMFARRVFELAASGSVVLSNTAAGVENFFGDSVLYADGPTDPLQGLKESDILRRQREAMAIAFEHTYRHRAESIFDAVGIQYNSMVGPSQLVGLVHDAADVEEIEKFRAQHRDDFAGVLYVVSPDADPTLTFSIGKSLSLGSAVVGHKEIADSEYRDRNLFSARTVIFYDPRSGDISDADIRLLRGFGNALDQPARIAGSDDARYRFGRIDNLNGVVAQAHRAQALLRDSESASVFGL